MSDKSNIANIERKLNKIPLDEDGNINEDNITSPFCSAKIKMETKGVARIEVKIIKPDADFKRLSAEIVDFYQNVIDNLEQRNIKTEDYKAISKTIDLNPETEANINKDSNTNIDTKNGFNKK